MIFCPPLESIGDPKYFFLLSIVSFLSPVVNIYVIFCLLFRSKKHMSLYRWLLLKHQLLGFILDLTMSIGIKPILLLPFPGGYVTGLFPLSIDAHYYAMLVFFISCMTQASVIHLFIYRYLLATGKKTFPLRPKIFLFIVYVIYTYPAVSFNFFYEEKSLVVAKLMKEFTCFTSDIASIPGLTIYDPEKILHYLCLPLIPLIFFTAASANILIFLTKRSLQHTSVSTKTARLQKRFLIQLVIQIAVPLIIIALPGMAVVYIIGAKIFNVKIPGFILLTSLSSYGTLGGLVLIAVNPTYYTYSCCKRKETEVKQIPKGNTNTKEKF